MPSSLQRYVNACTLTPNFRFRSKSSLQLMDLRCLPISALSVSAGMRNATAKRCAAFSPSTFGATSQNHMAKLVRNRKALPFAPIPPIDDDHEHGTSTFATNSCGETIDVREIH